MALCPRYGVAPLFWLAMGFIIERRDEYQLCMYILTFKGYQFLSTGLFALLSFAAVDAYCVSWAGIEDMYECRSAGPGQRPEYTWEACCFAAEVLAIYGAFLQLPYTTSDAAITRTFPKLELEIEMELGRGSAPRRSSRDNRDSRLNGHVNSRAVPAEPQAIRHRSGRKAPRRRGGLLRRLFMYDVCVFAIFVGLAVAPYLYRCREGRCEAGGGGEGGGGEGWQGGGEGEEGGGDKAAMQAALVRTVLVWMKTFYAICSLPFALFMLPLVNVFLHNAMPTAYDQYGRCCPYQYPSTSGAKLDAESEAEAAAALESRRALV